MNLTSFCSLHLSGGHSVSQEERSNKELLSSIKEFICWTKEYDDMVHSMIGIFATVLDIDRDSLSSGTDFFELGGSSLDTISIISRMESKVGIYSKS